MRTPHTQTGFIQAILRAGTRIRRLIVVSIGSVLLLGAVTSPALALDAVWLTSPGSVDWNTDSNWAPPTAPVNLGDTATFDASSQTLIELSADVTVDSITFNPGASAFTIDTNAFNSLSLAGIGVVNNSGATQTILNQFVIATTNFLNSATAANVTINNFGGSGEGTTNFKNNSSADSATIQNDAGFTNFFDNSTAGGATITSENLGLTQFFNSSTAANAIIVNDVGDIGPAETDFHDTSTAANAVITNSGMSSSTKFLNSSSAGNATLVNANTTAVFDISGLDLPGTTAGSIEGNGTLFLGSKNLITGGNKNSTTFLGIISDGGNNNNDTGGSLTKVGAGTLTLSSTNTYTGGTLINAGTLEGSHDGVLGGGDVSVTASGAILRLEGGATNTYIADTATLSIVSGATVDLNFSGNVDKIGSLVVDGVVQPAGIYGSATSGAPNQLPVFAGTGEVQVGVVRAPTITSANNTTFAVGSNGSFAVTATGVPTPTLSETGMLPSGITFQPATGLLSGTPAPGTNGVYPITLTASNGVPPDTTQSFTLTVNPALPVIFSPTAATATVGLPFSYQFEAIGATSLAVNSDLPAGLNFDPALRAIVGTPGAAGIFQIELSASNSFGTTDATLVLTIQAQPISGPVIISVTSATGRTNSLFHFQVITSGGSPTTQLTATGLPDGLTIDRATGEIFGIAAVDGSYLVTLSATDAGITNTATLQLTFTSDLAVPVIVSSVNAALFPGLSFLYTIDAPSSDTSDPITYSNITPLPPGLGLDQNTGIISGTFIPRLSLVPGPDLAGGVVTNTQLYACNSSGCAGQGLYFFLPSGAANISTRLNVGTGSDVGIAGFITKGNASMKILARGIGPSLQLVGKLNDPFLELHSGNITFTSNDNWINNPAAMAIIATGIPPTNDFESAILAGLEPGAYTAVLSGVNNVTGIGLVEVYNLEAASSDITAEAYLANISTRGNVQTKNSVMIGGFINLGAHKIQVLIRAIGPSLASQGVSGVLANPVLDVYDEHSALISTNDDWGNSPQKQDIIATTLAPKDALESAVLLTLPVGQHSYTAIVRGLNDTTGVGLVEAYFGDPGPYGTGCLGSSCP